MEERLFLIAVGWGSYILGMRQGVKRAWMDTRKGAALWHAAFCFLVGLSAMVVLTASWVDSTGTPVTLDTFWTNPSVVLSLLVSLVAAGWGFRSAHGLEAGAQARKGLLSKDLEWGDTVFSAVALAIFVMLCWEGFSRLRAAPGRALISRPATTGKAIPGRLRPRSGRSKGL